VCDSTKCMVAKSFSYDLTVSLNYFIPFVPAQTVNEFCL